MWKRLLCVAALIAAPLCAQTAAVSGTVINPDGSNFTGSISIQLAKSSIVNICMTPAQVVPFTPVTVKVTNGVFPTTQLFPTSCLSPRIPYYIQVYSATNQPVYSDNWYIPQTTTGDVDVGDLSTVQMASGITVSVPLAIVSTPVGNQTITQPPGTALSVNNLIVTGTFGGIAYTLPMLTLTGVLNSTYTGVDTFAGDINGAAVNASVNGTYNVENPPAAAIALGYRAAVPYSGSGIMPDNYTALNNALIYAAANNVCLFFPPGRFTMTSNALTWNSGETLCLRGTEAATADGLALSWIDYEGSGIPSVTATLTVDNSDSSTFYYSAIDWRDIGFAANANAPYAVYTNNVGGKSPTHDVWFAGGSVSAFGGFGFNAQASQQNWSVDGATIPCVNGVTFGQSASHYSFPSSQFTLYDSTITRCTGIGLNITDGNGINVVGAQIAANYQNLAVSGGQNVFVGGLYEKAGITAANDTVTGYLNTFIDIDESNVLEVQSGAAETEVSGYLGNKLQIDSGALGTVLGNIRVADAGSSYLSDLGTGTKYVGPLSYADDSTIVAGNIPQTQQVSQSLIAGLFGTYDPTVSVSGTWYITASNAVQPLSNQVFTTGKAWLAILHGQFACGSCTNPQLVGMPLTLSDVSNSVTLNNGETVIFQVDSGTGLFELTSAAGDVQYTGSVTFIPFSNVGAGSAPQLPTNPFSVTTQATAGWYTIATDYAGSDVPSHPLTTRLLISAFDNTYAQVIDLEVSGNYNSGTATCEIVRANSGGTVPVDAFRCSWLLGTGLQLDMHLPNAAAVTVTSLNGTKVGWFTPNPNPSPGATVLGGGNTGTVNLVPPNVQFLYSAAGTPLPTCNSGAQGTEAAVSDASGATYLGTYSSGGSTVAPVICNGSNWVTY